MSGGRSMTELERDMDRLEGLIGTLLRGGVMIAAAVVAVGGAIFLAANGGTPPSVRVFTGEPAAFRSVPGIVRAALHFDGRGVIALGLLILVATPLARVVSTLASFVHQKDWTFVVITGIVLVVLLSTLGPLL